MSTIARFALPEYDRMVACGVFDAPQPRRVELVRGEIRDMNPIGPMHETLVALLDDWSHEQAPRQRILVRVQSSIELPGLDCVPQPDLAWVARQDYSHRRPSASDVLLLIEVADTSLDYDRGEKAQLYALAGIPDYWLVRIPDQTIEVFREPTATGYRSIQPFTGSVPVRPLCLPDVQLLPSAVWKG